jgi:hypothetical protein
MWRVLRHYYQNVQSAVKTDGGVTGWFDVDVGVRQGCVISPLLFDVFVDRLAREVKALRLGVPAGGGRLSLLLYADDIVVLAESQKDLQKMMNAVRAFCMRWRLQVNMSKTKVMAFGSKGVENLDVRWGEEKIEEVKEYKYLGMWIEKGGSWKKAKEYKLRKARSALALAWNMATRGGDMSVRGATSMWTALIRPHLEYGAEVINNHNDFVWEEAELLARKGGRRVLRCGTRLPNDAVLGELGWMTMRGRRMFLRLSYWSKVLEMDDGRWVKQVYEEGRARLERRANASTWCNLTRKWLLELGLREEWEAQATGPEWQETLRARIMELESRRWRLRVAHNTKLESYGRWKPKLEREEYLEHENTMQRRMWTKLRGGCLELRVETGRWERMSVGGQQVAVPRHLRYCKMCFREVEDAAHVFFRCPAYRTQRDALADQVCKLATPGARKAMEGVRRRGREEEGSAGRRVEEACVMNWLMRGGGHEWGTMYGVPGGSDVGESVCFR